MYLAAILIVTNEVKGKGALALTRDLGLSYKTAFVLDHKISEARASEMEDRVIGGGGKTVEIDVAWFGGCSKPSNRKENRRDLRIAQEQTGKRKAVTILRERGGRTLTGVFRSESASVPFILARVAKGTTIVADEATS
jgi:ISXO2 transposase-like protein